MRGTTKLLTVRRCLVNRSLSKPMTSSTSNANFKQVSNISSFHSTNTSIIQCRESLPTMAISDRKYFSTNTLPNCDYGNDNFIWGVGFIGILVFANLVVIGLEMTTNKKGGSHIRGFGEMEDIIEEEKALIAKFERENPTIHTFLLHH